MTTHNLPRQSTVFVGRNSELAEIGTLLDDHNCRLLTLVGPGGIGKTRLAIEVANVQAETYRDGIYFVALQPLGSPDFIISTIASTVGFRFYPSGDPKQQFLDYFREKSVLLLLDNFEHLLDGTGLLSDLLACAPEVRLLITSRERLKLTSETVFNVTGMDYPDVAFPENAFDYEAVKLFVQSANRIRSNFAVDVNDLKYLVRICQLVGGMPLAIILAAAWVEMLTLEQLTTEISNSIDILEVEMRDLPERQRSIRATIDYSWNKLSDSEQSTFRKLSIFHGGFTREAAQAVTGTSLKTLMSLVNKSLLMVDSTGRFNIHELLRQYAAEKLIEAGEVNDITQHHLDYFLELAEQAETHEFGREQVIWFDRLEIELDNLRAALNWSLESETGLRLAAAMGWFFTERGHLREGFEWLEGALAANKDAPISLRSKGLHSAGAVCGQLSDTERKRDFFMHALTLARTANDRWNAAWALSHLGYTIILQENLEHSVMTLEESLSLFRELEDAMGMSHGLIRLARVVLVQKDYSHVSVLLDEAWILAHKVGDRIIMGWAQFLRGEVHFLQNRDFGQARNCYEDSLYMFREARFPIGVSLSLFSTAFAELAIGNNVSAQTYFEEALILARKTAFWIEGALAGLMNVAKADGQLLRAAQLLGASESNERGGLAKRYLETVRHERNVATLRTQLGETAFAQAFTAGKAMTREQAIVYALEGRTATSEAVNAINVIQSHSAIDSVLIETLSRRELEVLQLIAAGLSNAEIAARLYLSVGTVKVHSRRIYGKLGVNKRTHAVIQAKKLHLL